MVLRVLLLLLAVCGAAQAPPPDPVPTTDGGAVVWSPDILQGEQIAAVTRNAAGGLEVFAATDHVYQRGSMRGPSYDGSLLVPTEFSIEYVEVFRDALGDRAAKYPGLRNPFRFSLYPVLVFDAAARAGGVVQVFSNGTNYLFVLTTKRRTP